MPSMFDERHQPPKVAKPVASWPAVVATEAVASEGECSQINQVASAANDERRSGNSSTQLGGAIRR
jgi:hypothetical protein